MIKTTITNNETIHNGNFGINIVISHPISGLTISDFIFEAVSGNGTNDIVLPENLEVAYLPQTVLMIPIDLPDNVSGSFRVSMQDKLYSIDNTQYDIDDSAIDIPDMEQSTLSCDPKIFEYSTTEA